VPVATGAPSSSAAGSGKAGGPSAAPRNATGAMPPLPRPSSTKPLDIQRDLP
jgi:hypothetical protein